MPHPETQIPMARPHPTPQKHDSPNTNPNACAVKSSSTLQHLTFPHDSSLFHTNLTRHVSIRNLLQKLPPMASNLRRDDDDKRRGTQTTRDDDATQATQTQLQPPDPQLKTGTLRYAFGKKETWPSSPWKKCPASTLALFSCSEPIS